MTINEYKQKYASLTNAQVRSLAETSSEFRVETETLYKNMYNATLNKSCGDCWCDAYVTLMVIDPAKYDALSGRAFDLKAGALLLDVVGGDNSKMCTRKNLTDDLALYHLKTNPGCKDQFSRLPDNWEELVAAYTLPTKKKATRSKAKK